jgi:hypothetical protein
VLFFNWAPRHEGVLGEWMYSSTYSLTSALDGREWSASRSGRCTPREGARGSLMSPRAVQNAVVKRKILTPSRESNPRTPIVQPVPQRYTDWAIMALRSHHYSHESHLTVFPSTHYLPSSDTVRIYVIIFPQNKIRLIFKHKSDVTIYLVTHKWSPDLTWFELQSLDAFNLYRYKGVSKSFRTDRLELELQMAQLSATGCSCIAILWVSVVSFAAITFYVASQRVIPKTSVHFVYYSVRKRLVTPSYSFGLYLKVKFWAYVLSLVISFLNYWISVFFCP